MHLGPYALAMRQTRTFAAGAAMLLALALTGCSFLTGAEANTTGRTPEVLRALVDELKQLDQVIDARYSINAYPAVEVDLRTNEFDDWDEVVQLIAAAAGAEPLSAHTVMVELTSDRVHSFYGADDGGPWFSRGLMEAAAGIDAIFPGATVNVAGAGDLGVLDVTVTDSAERVLEQLAGDGALRAAVAGLDPHYEELNVTAPGLTISGAPPSDEVAAWAAEVLTEPAPRLPAVLGVDDPPEGPREAVKVTVYTGVVGDPQIFVQLRNADEFAAGPVWDFLTRVLATPLPPAIDPDPCVELLVSFTWPGIDEAETPLITNTCSDSSASDADPDRPAAVDLREALAASGLDLDELGLRVS